MQEGILWAMKNTLPILGFLLAVTILVAWLMMRKGEKVPEAFSSFQFMEKGEVKCERKVESPEWKKKEVEINLPMMDIGPGIEQRSRDNREKTRNKWLWKRGVARSWESDEHRALLVMCMGDVEKAERLIEFEKKKLPGANREIWIKEAIARWGRDLHRL